MHFFHYSFCSPNPASSDHLSNYLLLALVLDKNIITKFQETQAKKTGPRVES